MVELFERERFRLRNKEERGEEAEDAVHVLRQDVEDGHGRENARCRQLLLHDQGLCAKSASVVKRKRGKTHVCHVSDDHGQNGNAEAMGELIDRALLRRNKLT